MSARLGALALVLLALAAPGTPAHAEDAPPDSLGAFFKGLSDSTDASYGTQSVVFDTTGLDSLAANALLKPPRVKKRGTRFDAAPLLGFHRAEGTIVGLNTRVGTPAAGFLSMGGTYSFGNQLGRYAFGYRRTLLYHGLRRTAALALPGRILDGATRLDLEIGYARSSLAFMPEHAGHRLWNIEPVLSGKGSASLYERRGAEGSLTFWTGDWRFLAGARHVVEKPMYVVTDWTLFHGSDAAPPNTPAVDEEFTEPFGSLGFRRADWELAGLIDARGGGADRWRLRGVLGKSFRLGPDIKTVLQFEGGATAANAPRQRRFEIGGDRAIPSLPLGTGGTDHILVGKFEFIEAHDVLRAIGIGHPDWLVLQPLASFQSGVVWDDPAGRDVVFSKPPSAAWRSSAGLGLALRLGVPDPDTMMRFYVGLPVGPEGGNTEFRASLSTTYDLLGPL
jgi:hypothetical protein